MKCCFILANLWVWSSPREGYPGHPINPNFVHTSKQDAPTEPAERPPGQITATFLNEGSRYETVELYYGDDVLWAQLSKFDPPVSVHTYKGHVWNVKTTNGELIRTWTIENNQVIDQEFRIE
jgi:hypothetical protein